MKCYLILFVRSLQKPIINSGGDHSRLQDLLPEVVHRLEELLHEAHELRAELEEARTREAQREERDQQEAQADETELLDAGAEANRRANEEMLLQLTQKQAAKFEAELQGKDWAYCTVSLSQVDAP